ncbi:MAG: DUF3429 domain-containing protein [Pseudomonadota bacterium]
MTASAKRIPTSALILGLAGVLPFLWGAATCVFDALFDLGQTMIGARFVGSYVIIFYGTIILAFMSGVLWGFATRAEPGRAAWGYALSTMPALWAFFFVGGGAERALIFLILGFLGLLGLDYRFWRWGLAPAWWMQLRVMLTALVVLCMLVGLAG